MAWEIFNALKTGARPTWLYHFEIGTQQFYYTSAAREFTTPIGSPSAAFLAEQDWQARSVKMSNVRRAQSSAKNNVKITLPREDALSAALLASVGITEIRVTVWQGFADDTDFEFVTMFLGTLKQLQPSYKQLVLTFTDRSSVLENSGITRVIQGPCPYEVFGAGCGLSENAHKFVSVATAIDGASVTVTGAEAFPARYFKRGRLKFGDQQQTIDTHNGSAVVVLSGPVAGLLEEITTSGSADVELLPGCKKSLANCEDFDNIENYGGLPKIRNSPYTGNGVL